MTLPCPRPCPKLVTAAALVVCALACDLTPPPAGAGGATASGPVTLLVEPDAGAPAILDLLGSARRSLWMEMYLLTDARAIAALAARAAAGCNVRVILEPAPYQDAAANQGAFDQLAAAGVDVRWATPRFTYTHAKFFTVDHARLADLTLNLTTSGLAGNREYAAIDDDPIDVAAAEAIFTADALGAPAPPAAGRLVISPDSSRPVLLGLIAGARASLALETEELTDPAVVAALRDAQAGGVAVTLGWPGPAQEAPASVTALTAAGATVRAIDAPPIHGKVAVADERTLYLGSANLSPTSLDENRELGLLLTDPALAAEVGAVVARDTAGSVAPTP